MALAIDLVDVVANLARISPQIFKLITAGAYLIGIGLFANAVYNMKQYGEMHTMTSQETDLRYIMLKIAGAAALIYLPSTLEVALQTVYGQPNILAYGAGNADRYTSLTKSIIIIVKIVGLISFIRGLVILASLSKNGQPGTFSKGLTHIIAGVLAINIYQTWKILMKTIGAE